MYFSYFRNKEMCVCVCVCVLLRFQTVLIADFATDVTLMGKLPS